MYSKLRTYVRMQCNSEWQEKKFKQLNPNERQAGFDGNGDGSGRMVTSRRENAERVRLSRDFSDAQPLPVSVVNPFHLQTSIMDLLQLSPKATSPKHYFLLVFCSLLPSSNTWLIAAFI